MTGKPLRGARILVAEDNPILAFDLIGLLAEAGAGTLGPAKSLSEALALVSSPLLDCGVLDVSLCDDLVFPAAEVLRDRGLGIVFYTGYGDPESLGRAWPSAHILTKPAPPQLLIRAVTAACGPMAARSTAPA
jgi:CheY-like chemotaxis protein